MPPLLKIKQLNVITINYTARAAEKFQANPSVPANNLSISSTRAA
jgi:hypothetical protein